jgi:hypothetical protein
MAGGPNRLLCPLRIIAVIVGLAHYPGVLPR